MIVFLDHESLVLVGRDAAELERAAAENTARTRVPVVARGIHVPKRRACSIESSAKRSPVRRAISEVHRAGAQDDKTIVAGEGK